MAQCHFFNPNKIIGIHGIIKNATTITPLKNLTLLDSLLHLDLNEKNLFLYLNSLMMAMMKKITTKE